MKKFYKSRTLWVNVIALTAIAAQLIADEEILSTEAQVSILAIVNVLLRLDTDTALEK